MKSHRLAGALAPRGRVAFATPALFTLTTSLHAQARQRQRARGHGRARSDSSAS